MLKKPSVARQAKSELPQELMKDIDDLRKVYKEAPVSYFEAKPRHVVGGDEFYGAYIPQNAPQQVLDDLGRLGVSNINTYADSDDLDRLLVNLANKGERGLSPYVLGLGGIVPAGGILAGLIGGNDDRIMV